MAVHRSPGGLTAAALSLVLLVVGCAGTPDESPDLAAGSTAVADPSTTTATTDPADGNGTTGKPSTPRPEGTDPEQPRPPGRPAGSVAIAGPGIGPGDTWAVFSTEQQTDCLRVVLSGEFPGDAVVDSVRVGPAGAFQRADDACDSDPDDGPRCTGFVFTDGAGGCRTGVRWLPDSGETAGSLSLSFSGACRSGAGACAEVGPGTQVTFTNAARLEARLQPDGTPDAGNGETASPSTEQSGGKAGPGAGSSSEAGAEAPNGGAAEAPDPSTDQGPP